MPKVSSIDEMQKILEGWFRKPGESDEDYRARLNDPTNEISIPLFGVPKLMAEQEERVRFENAKPVERVMGLYHGDDDMPDVLLGHEKPKNPECKCPRNGFADPACPKHGDLD